MDANRLRMGSWTCVSNLILQADKPHPTQPEALLPLFQ